MPSESRRRASADSRTQLHFGPYRAPRFHVGDRVACLLRDADCVVTSWSDARIPWPRVRALEAHGGSGLLLNDELARAVRHESAAAVMHWWGVGAGAVWSWRRALGVGRKDNKGTMELMQAAAEKGAAAVQAREFTQAERQARAPECPPAKPRAVPTARLPRPTLDHGATGVAGHHGRCRRGRDGGSERQRGPAAAGEEKHPGRGADQGLRSITGAASLA